MTNSGLVAIGFIADDGDTLRATAGGAVTVAPARGFYHIAIILPNSTVATCTIHQIALKVRERASISSISLTAD